MTQLAYGQKQAAALLGYSVSHFNRHVRPELPMPIIVGGRKTWRHEWLAAWLEKQ